jgi:hypothetical protein
LKGPRRRTETPQSLHAQPQAAPNPKVAHAAVQKEHRQIGAQTLIRYIDTRKSRTTERGRWTTLKG